MDRAIVVDNRDPAGKGRLRLQIPRLTGDKSTDWVWPVVSSGFLVTPKPGEQVWVTYEGDDPDFPLWVGKTDTTESYKNLLQRVKTLEDTVALLQTNKANVGHTHG